MKTINEILVEANLTEAQVDQVAGIVQEAVAADRAKLREAHTAEIAKIEESRSNVVTALMKDLSEANKKLEEATKKVSESDDADADDAPGANEDEDDDADDLEEAAISTFLSLDQIKSLISVVEKDGKLKGLKIGLSNKTAFQLVAPGVVVGCSIGVADGVKVFIQKEGDETGRSIGYDVSGNNFTLRSDFSNREPLPKDQAALDLGASTTVSEAAFKLAADALEEALTRIHPMLKQARAYGQLKQSMVTVQESFQRVFGDVAPLPATPAAVVQESTVVDQSAEVERLRAEVFDLRCHEIFNSLTSDLAESTKIRVSQLVDMAHSSTLQEYTELVEVAISHNKIISEQSKPAPAAILEERKVDNSMAKYLKVLAK